MTWFNSKPISAVFPDTGHDRVSRFARTRPGERIAETGRGPTLLWRQDVAVAGMMKSA